MAKMDRIVWLAYNNPLHPISFGSAHSAIKFFKGSASPELVKNVLSQIPAYTRKRAQRRVKCRSPIFVYFRRELLQADLIDISYLSRENSRIKFLFTIIDSATRYAWIIPLKNKKAKTTASEFGKLLDKLDVQPSRILVDAGGEFKGQFKDLLKRRGIKLTLPLTSTHAPGAERFNQTIQSLIYRYLASSKTSRYIDRLGDILKSYNNRVHSSISPMTPSEAEKESSRGPLVRRLIKNYSRAYLRGSKIKNDLKVGDLVLVSVNKTAFHRGYNNQFNEELFAVSRVDQTKNVPMYQLKTARDGEVLRGLFYREEIQKTMSGVKLSPLPEHRISKTRGRGVFKDVYIEWSNYPRFNMWIPQALYAQSK